jgi:hypothetical protein
MRAKHGNTGNQHAKKDVRKDATMNIRLRKSSKDKAARDAVARGISPSQQVEDAINSW